MSELPNGWTHTKLGTICSKPQYGWTSRASREGRIKYLRTTDISSGEINWDNVPFCEIEPDDIEKFRIHEDDVFVSRAGSVGVSFRIKEVPYEAVFASYLIRFTSLEAVLPQYIECFLKSQDYWRSISELSAGIAVPNINASKLAELEIPLPPLNEQRRIVAKLRKLLSLVSAAQARLATIPDVLKRFRQSVLSAGCAGHLTANWREQNLAVLPAATLIKDNGFKLVVSGNDLQTLPTNWEWAPLGNYCKCSRGRFSVRPRNDPSYFGGEYPFIQIGDLPPNGGRITSHRQTLNEKGLAVSKKFPKGTVVIAIVGATIGNTGILSYDMCFTDSMVGIESGSIVGNAYVELFLRSRKDDIRQSSYAGGGQPNIKLETLNPYPLALPPFAEQQEIVRRVEALFQTADALEARYLTAKGHIDKLMQSILAKAFRGELVPQDPNDEPASILLKRIRAARARDEDPQENPKRAASIRTKRTKVIMLKRQEIQHTHLSDILKSHGPLQPEALWSESQLDIDDFYDQLKLEETRGLLKETSKDASKSQRLLEAA